MSPRKLLRLVLAVVVLGLLWIRIARQWRYESHWWLIGSAILSALLLLLVVFLIAGVFRKPRNPRDDVPKHPLGLDG
jgi:RsiW-degrading membrane proteinase PrsW (M82 family)